MKICLVTDRRRLGAATGTPPEAWLELLREQVAAAVIAGIDFIQVREPDLETADLVDLVRSLVARADGTRSRVLVNDRVDVALASRAAGVHLKESGFLPTAVRRITPAGFLIGCSVHSAAAAVPRKAADYMIAGTVMPTVSKPSVDHLDEQGLRAIVEACAGTPVLGIGGLSAASAPLLAAAGAAGLAAVGAFIPMRGEAVSEFVQKRVHELRFALESASKPT